MGGSVFPPLTELTSAHVLHRWVAAIVGLIVLVIAIVAINGRQRSAQDLDPGPPGDLGQPACTCSRCSSAVRRLLPSLLKWTQTLHLALGATIWALMVGLAFTAYYEARVSAGTAAGLDAGGRTEEPGERTRSDTVRAATSRSPSRASSSSSS